MISDPDVIGLLYLAAIICFIVALRQLSSPKHARKGNWVGGLGMAIAIVTTLLLDGIGNWALLVVAAATTIKAQFEMPSMSRVVAIATSIPTPPIQLPRRACFGDERKRSARTKQTIETR